MRNLLQILRPAPPEELLSSRLCDEQSFYGNFLNDLSRCRNTVVIESPYITCRRVARLSPIFRKLRKRGVKIIINTRNPQEHDTYLRIQAYMGISRLRSIGVLVNTLSNYHHRKIAVLDKYILWEGSLNILSQNNSREIMRRIESVQLATQMVRFIGIKV